VRAILVSMPFYTARAPSIQLGLLAAVGKAAGFEVDTLHLTLDFSAMVGSVRYEELCLHHTVQLGNWLFAPHAFGDENPDGDDALLRDFAEDLAVLRQFGIDEPWLRRIRHEAVPEFLDHCVRSTDWARHDVVGFTTTFQQNTAAFALARRLKQDNPGLITVFGGANVQDEMGEEHVRASAFIDYVIQGDADQSFPEFLAALSTADPKPETVPGVLSRQRPLAERPKPFADLERLPIPDYHEYFARSERLGFFAAGERASVQVPFEGSRGCWWGHKHHCTFCGLNRATIGPRRKSPARIGDELAELARRHGVFCFTAVDNIMSQDVLRDLVPALAREQRNYEIFFEIKANLSRAQVKALGEGGITALQPGIESLNSRVLRLMRKGVRASQNVNLLRWAHHYGITVAWNLLWGFPGETVEDYDAQAALVPHLVHLQPPVAFTRITLDRFSPFHFDGANFPRRQIAPEPSLAYVYPARMDLMRIAYAFEHEFEDELPPAAFDAVSAAAAAWQAAWKGETAPRLDYRWSPGLLHIDDRRNPSAACRYTFGSPLSEIYTALSDSPTSAPALREKLDLPWSAEEISDALDLFVEKGLVMRDEELFLALAIPASRT
jgi:ribosomal peptide maturation radical SAM protein 1